MMTRWTKQTGRHAASCGAGAAIFLQSMIRLYQNIIGTCGRCIVPEDWTSCYATGRRPRRFRSMGGLRLPHEANIDLRLGRPA
ncbi:hypothetical protein LshimejAT787_0210380 [Lyophyllum shimeji]|uniref:Uncharacterized protein n=1 Tax=Lyophyllum shimeji TaxID=47721 RepID=A0A9P3PGE8_LYOSH|nr:hypothetical protein LshimejAT787_0210380 [Lyophyllum shimeji]